MKIILMAFLCFILQENWLKMESVFELPCDGQYNSSEMPHDDQILIFSHPLYGFTGVW